MSGKIPLEKTIGGAYSFLFSDFPSIIGIAWFPIALFGGLAACAVYFGAVAHPLPPLSFDSAADAMAFAYAAARVVLPVFLCAVVAGVMLTAGLTRRALEQTTGTTWIYFNLGAQFWRMFAAIFLAVLLLGVLRLLLQLIRILWAHFVAGLLPPGISIIVGVLAALLLAAFYIYCCVRLVFLLPAVVVAEKRIGIVRAWQLGLGNFWRSTACLAAVLLPAIAVFAILSFVLFSGFFRHFPIPGFVGRGKPSAGELTEYLRHAVRYVLAFVRSNWPALLAVQFLYSIVFRSLFAGASANAYRGVTAAGEVQPG